MSEYGTQFREGGGPEWDFEEDRNPESGSLGAGLLTQPSVPSERTAQLVDTLGLALRVGADQAGDGPEADVITYADRWLRDTSGMTYGAILNVLELADAQDGIDWAHSLIEPPTAQFDVRHVVGYANPFSAVMDYATAAWDVTGAPWLRLAQGKPTETIGHDLSRAWQHATQADTRLDGYGGNPYGNQLANTLGVHSPADALWAALDVVDIASLRWGGAVIAPVRQMLREAAERGSRLEVADAIASQSRSIRPLDRFGPGTPEGFDSLADDAVIHVFHGTTTESAAAIRETGVAGEKGMFVAPTRETAEKYLDPEGEILEFTVRKRDLVSRPFDDPALDEALSGEQFYEPLIGGFLPPGTQVEAYRPNQISKLEGLPGTPTTYYHGTAADFEDFDYGGDLLEPGTWGRNTPNADSGLGFHFSTSPESAEFIGPNIMERRLRLENPLEVDEVFGVQGLRIRAYISELGLDDLYEESYRAWRVKEGLPPISDATDPASRLLADMHERTYLENWRQEAVRIGNRRIMQRDHPTYPPMNEYSDESMVPNLDSLTDEQHELYSELTGGEVAGNIYGVGTRGDEITREWLKGLGYDGLHIREAFMGPDDLQYREGLPEQASWVVFDLDQISKLEGLPGTPEEWMYYTDGSGRKQYKGAGAFENPAGPDIQKVKDELGWTDDQFDQAKAAWANDPQRIEDQVAREAERLDMELDNLNPDPTDELLELSDLDPEVRDAINKIADDLGRSLGEHAEGRNLVREVEEYLGITGTPKGLPGTPEAYLDEIRSDPESFYGTRGLTQAQIDGGMRTSSADLDQMSWEQMFDLMRNASDPVYGHIEDEFMRRYNFLYGLKDQFVDHPQLDDFLRVFPEMTYPPETFGDMIAFAADPDLGTFGSDQADFITKIARDIDEWWGEFRGGLVDGPPGTPERIPTNRVDEDLMERYPQGYMPEDFVFNEPKVFDPNKSPIEQLVRDGEITRDQADALLEGVERIRTFPNAPGRQAALEGPPGTPLKDLTPDEIDQIVRNEGGLTDAEIEREMRRSGGYGGGGLTDSDLDRLARPEPGISADPLDEEIAREIGPGPGPGWKTADDIPASKAGEVWRTPDNVWGTATDEELLVLLHHARMETRRKIDPSLSLIGENRQREFLAGQQADWASRELTNRGYTPTRGIDDPWEELNWGNIGIDRHPSGEIFKDFDYDETLAGIQARVRSWYDNEYWPQRVAGSTGLQTPPDLDLDIGPFGDRMGWWLPGTGSKFNADVTQMRLRFYSDQKLIAYMDDRYFQPGSQPRALEYRKLFEDEYARRRAIEAETGKPYDPGPRPPGHPSTWRLPEGE